MAGYPVLAVPPVFALAAMSMLTEPGDSRAVVIARRAIRRTHMSGNPPMGAIPVVPAAVVMAMLAQNDHAFPVVIMVPTLA